MVGRIGTVQAVMYREMSGLVDQRLGEGVGMTGKNFAWRDVSLASFIRDVVLRMDTVAT
jgi:hypothetical protein